MKIKTILMIGSLIFITNGCIQPSPWTKDKYDKDYKECDKQTQRAANFINVKLDNFITKDLGRSVTENCMKDSFGWTNYRLDEVREEGYYIKLGK